MTEFISPDASYQQLCRMEGGAAETYRLLLDGWAMNESRLAVLTDIHRNHERSFQDLAIIERRQYSPEEREPLVWREVSGWLGEHGPVPQDGSVLDLLIARETECERHYQEAISNEKLDPEVVEYIGDVLLLRTLDNAARLIDLKCLAPARKPRASA